MKHLAKISSATNTSMANNNAQAAIIGAGTVWKVARQTAGGLRDEVPQKLKHFYNCDDELWASFVAYFCFSVFFYF